MGQVNVFGKDAVELRELHYIVAKKKNVSKV